MNPNIIPPKFAIDRMLPKIDMGDLLVIHDAGAHGFSMGALKSGAFPVELNGKEYGLLFSLNALDEVQEKFGGYDKLSEVFNKDNPNLFKDTRWLLTLLINEALLAEDENAQLLEEKRVGRLIHAGNLQEVQNAIFKSFYRGTAGDNSDTENENDGEETTEEGNRAAVRGSIIYSACSVVAIYSVHKLACAPRICLACSSVSAAVGSKYK